MRIRKLFVLLLLPLLAACGQVESISRQIKALTLPNGITYLKWIEPRGLQSPAWSPDGKKIAASYLFAPMGDAYLCFFCSPARFDTIVIDTQTWKVSELTIENMGATDIQLWSPDSNRIVLNTYLGNDKCNVQIVDVINPTLTCFYSNGYAFVSPDLNKAASFKDYLLRYLTIRNLSTGEDKVFQMPKLGTWSISAWSSDSQKLSLVYKKNQYAISSDIFVLTLSSGTYEQITNDDYDNGPAIFSPDGQLIAFGKFIFNNEGGWDTKWSITKLDHSCQWTIPMDEWIHYAAWSPDSQKLFLVSNNGAYLADMKILFGSDFPNNCPASK